MILHFFSQLEDIQELKSAYRALTKKHHPDITNDNGDAMKKINAEYDWILKNGIKSKDGINLNEDEIILEKEYRDVVENTCALDGLIVELFGRWIWFTGETYKWKHILKDLNCKFSGKKSAWYWRPDEEKVFSRKKLTMDEIRRLHGTKQFSYKQFQLA